MQQIKNLTRFSAVVMAATLAAGCATVTQEQLDAVQATANSALSEARDAASLAQNAMNIGNEASSAAQQAQQTAEAALACCNDNSDKIENMFEKAMMK